jgi:hypothetical protein
VVTAAGVTDGGDINIPKFAKQQYMVKFTVPDMCECHRAVAIVGRQFLCKEDVHRSSFVHRR